MWQCCAVTWGRVRGKISHTQHIPVDQCRILLCSSRAMLQGASSKGKCTSLLLQHLCCAWQSQQQTASVSQHCNCFSLTGAVLLLVQALRAPNSAEVRSEGLKLPSCLLLRYVFVTDVFDWVIESI